MNVRDRIVRWSRRFTWLIMALPFGAGALFIVWSNLYVLLSPTNAVTDGREVVVLLGSALTGPFGGMVIGALSAFLDPIPDIRWFSLVLHVANGCLIGWLYARYVSLRSRNWTRVLLWTSLVVAYYFVVPIPILLLIRLVAPTVFASVVPASASVLGSIRLLLAGWVSEFILTWTFTTLILLILPRKYRQPQWTVPPQVDLSADPDEIRPARGNWSGRMSIRLTFWFLLLSFIPLVVVSVFVRDTVSQAFLLSEASKQREVARSIAREIDRVGRVKALRDASETYPGPSHRVFVIDKEGNYLIHPDSSRVGKNIASDFAEASVKSVLAGRTGLTLDPVNGWSIGYSPTGPAEYRVISVQAREVVQHALVNLENNVSIKLGSVMLLMSLVAGIIIWILVGRPMERLTHAANEVGRGNISVSVNPADMEDEIEELAFAFNDMTENLGRMHEGMEGEIAQRKATEEVLRDREKQFRLLAENSTDMISRHDLNGRFLYASPVSQPLLGYAPEELVGRPVYELIHPDDVSSSVEHDRRIVHERRSAAHVVRVRRKDGAYLWIEAISRAVVDPAGGGYAEIQVSSRDVTERHIAEIALKESEEQFRGLFEHAVLGFYRTTPDGRILMVNPALCRMLGYDTAAELQRRNLEVDGFHPEYPRSDFKDAINANNEIIGRESAWIRKDGGRIFVRENAKAVRDAEGAIRYFEGTVEDITERKLAEEQLNLFFDVAVEMLCITDLHGFFQRLSPSWTATLGWTPEELLSRPFIEWVHPDDQEATREATRRLTVGTQVVEFDNRYRCKDGSYRWLSWNSFGVVDRGVIIAAARDITERKRSEILKGALYQISQATDRVATRAELFKSVHEIVGTVMPADNFYIALYDAENDLLSFPYFVDEVDPPPLPVHPRKGLTEYVLRTGNPLLCDEATNADLARRGEIAIVGTPAAVWAGVPLIIESRPIGVMVVKHYRDAHAYGVPELELLQFVSSNVAKAIERKHSEEALRESEKRLQKAQTLAEVGNWEIDLQTRIVRASQEAYRIYGIDRAKEELPLDFVQSIVVERDRLRLSEALERLLHANEEYDVEFEIRRMNDGEIRQIHSKAEILFSPEGVPKRVMGVLQDITDRKKAEHEHMRLEAELAQVQRMESIGTLSAGIAHDFNNILNIIMGNASLLERRSTDQAAVQRRVSAIAKASERGAQVVKQLLTFARKTEVHRQPVTVNDIIRETSRLLEETFPKTVLFELELEPHLPSILADPNQLHQVLLNLCVNARDAMPNGGTITFAAQVVPGSEVHKHFARAKPASYVSLRVRDTGTGIDDETMKHLFDPFYTTKEIGRGTGLGLSAALGIVERHDGFIDVQSRLGEGTEFTIFLPVAVFPYEGTRDQELATSSAPGGDETILFVEDEELGREMAVEHLAHKGYTVILARDGAEAVELFRTRHQEIDLVLSDFGLPAFNGEEVYRRMKEARPDVPFILFSGFVEPEKKQALLALGMRHVVSKPYEIDFLLQLIREVLDSRPSA